MGVVSSALEAAANAVRNSGLPADVKAGMLSNIEKLSPAADVLDVPGTRRSGDTTTFRGHRRSGDTILISLLGLRPAPLHIQRAAERSFLPRRHASAAS
jgi:hypothetical protein